MKKRQKNKLIIILLINFSLLSILYYINSIKVRDSEYGIGNHDLEDYLQINLDFIDDSLEVFATESIESFQLIEVKCDINYLLDESKEILYVISFSGTCILCEFFIFFNGSSINETTKATKILEVEGIRVTKEEMNLLDLIQEYLSNNRVFNKEKAIQYIRSRNKNNGNLNYNGIRIVVDSLLQKNLIVEGSKFTRRNVLNNTNRNQILRIIKENPGIYKNKLAKKLNLCSFVIKWHIKMLVKFKMIREHNLNTHIGYFDAKLNPQNDDILQITSKEKCKRIIELLGNNKNGLTKNQISKALNMHYNTVTKYLNEIDNFKLLNRKKVNNREEIITLNEKEIEIINF
ncbi:MAG: hypothetical protein ACFE8N_08855 [Promethearchaeota archaeon]